tara:strand:+ start:7875 stop:8444 length:570 start_codon:yes stop_codon:yes gene_type:complete
MSWWDIIKQNPYKEAGLGYQENLFQQPIEGSQTTFPQGGKIPIPPKSKPIEETEPLKPLWSGQQNLEQQILPQNQTKPALTSFTQQENKPIRELELGQRTLSPFMQDKQPQQQQTNTPAAADSGDAGSDVGQTVSRIKQHLARNPQGAKGIKMLPIIEKLILASQNPTGMQQEVKDAVKQLKQIVPTAV